MRFFAIAALALLAAVSVWAAEDGPRRGGFQYEGGGAAPATDDALFKDLGGEEKIAAFTRNFVARIAADDRIGHYFAKVDRDRLARKLTDQFIDLSGGPVKYRGGNMKGVHEALDITAADFNRLVEDLQLSMDSEGVPFAAQNRLLALLAPMERAIVTK